MNLSPVELRHRLHQNPELAFKEFETTKLLLDNIREMDSKKKLKIHTPFKTGLLAEYSVDNGDYILFRADIDALPIEEETGAEFRSKNNFMHACGHDIHTSILYSFLGRILESKIDRNILFLFQPAEESGGGAMKFYNTGVFDKFDIKHAFALHVTDEYSEGEIASTSGVLFASSLEVDIEFRGVSSHVAFPERGKNSFDALRLFVDAVDKLSKDITEPFIFGMGKIYAGEVRNITPAYAKIEGTLRGLSVKIVENFCENLKVILKGIEEITGVKISLSTGAKYPEVLVDDSVYENIIHVFKKEFKYIDCGYKMTGEDFGYFSHKYPSFMFWLGTSKGERFGLHNPRFLPDDRVIELGTAAFSQILNRYL